MPISSYKKIFIFSVLFLLASPQLYFIGTRDRTILYGVEENAQLPSLQDTSFRKREFQLAFENWWNHHFGFRKFMSKIKNQTYDWANLGQFHNGFSQTVVQAKNRRLLTKPTIYPLLSNQCYYTLSDASLRHNLQKISDWGEKNGKRIIFFLAPSASETYSEDIPELFKFFQTGHCETLEEAKKFFTSIKLDWFDAQEYFNNLPNEPYPLFPKTGTHWSKYGSTIAINEMLKTRQIGAMKITNVLQMEQATAENRDIADLLNLWFPYKVKNEKYYDLTVSANKNFDGRISVIGDSFALAFNILAESNTVKPDNFLLKANQYISTDEIEYIKHSDVIIFEAIEMNLRTTQSFLISNIQMLADSLN